MDILKLLASRGLLEHPAGLVGCRAHGSHSESCGYDVVIFDEMNHTSDIVSNGYENVMIHHSSLSESEPVRQAGYYMMDIIRDDTLLLASLVNQIHQKRDVIFANCARDCLAESILCLARSDNTSNVKTASCLQKCAGVYAAEAVTYMAGHTPSSHMLDAMRRSGSSAASIIVESLGIERASSTLITRMTDAASNLNALAGGTVQMVRLRAALLVQDRRMADCYLYLCRVGRSGKMAAPNNLTADYAAQIAMDVESDMIRVRKMSSDIRNVVYTLLEQISKDDIDNLSD